MMGEGDYVVALEPCNVPCENRASLRRKNILPFLGPGESRSIDVEIGVLEGEKDIAAFESSVRTAGRAQL